MLYAIISNASIALCFVPFLFLSWKKIRQVRTYWVIGIYWLLNGVINLPDLDTPANNSLQEKVTQIYNLLDIPLVLLMFLFAAPGRRRKGHLTWSLLLYSLAEILLFQWKGYAFTFNAVLVGSGLVLIFCITGLVQFMREMEHTSFENSMAFVYGAMLFAYGSFLLIYLFVHTHPGITTSGSKDWLLLYYTNLLLTTAVTSIGLWGYGVRQPPQQVA